MAHENQHDLLKRPHKLERGEYKADPTFQSSEYPKHKYRVSFNKKEGKEVVDSVVVKDAEDEAAKEAQGYKADYPDGRQKEKEKAEKSA